MKNKFNYNDKQYYHLRPKKLTFFQKVLNYFGLKQNQEDAVEGAEDNLERIVYPKLTSEEQTEYYIRLKNGENKETIRQEILNRAKIIKY
jgi:hypothetical protein